jgi:hypothetical protein
MTRTALIVGADRIAAIRTQLLESPDLALDDVEHWTGRTRSDATRTIPATTALVVCITERVGHMAMHNIRRQAKRRQITVVFCSHSATELRERLKNASTKEA